MARSDRHARESEHRAVFLVLALASGLASGLDKVVEEWVAPALAALDVV